MVKEKKVKKKKGEGLFEEKNFQDFIDAVGDDVDKCAEDEDNGIRPFYARHLAESAGWQIPARILRQS